MEPCQEMLKNNMNRLSKISLISLFQREGNLKILHEFQSFCFNLSVSIFLVDKPDGTRIRESNNKYFPSGPPAMSWLYVAGLFRPDVKVEIEGIAAVD